MTLLYLALLHIYIISVHCSKSPNFIFIIADDLGFNDVPWRGSTNIYAPNLNSLRNDNALELTRFYVQPMCSPTRTSFMTGRYPYKMGMQHLVGLAEFHTCGIEPSINTTYFTERLKSCLGYSNYYLGKWHQGEYKWSYTPIYRGGFDYFKGYLNNQIGYFNFSFKPDLPDDITTETFGWIYDWRENTDILLSTDDTYTTTAIGEKALQIISNISDTNDDTPFTMIVAFEAPHNPVHWAPGDWKDDAINGGGPWGNATTDDYYEDRQKYATMVTAMDDYIGQIVDALQEKRVNDELMWDNTYLVFFSDNGGIAGHASNYPLRGAKGTHFEGGIRVPALIAGGLLDDSLQGTNYTGLVHVSDLYATVMDLTNTSSSDLSLDGHSLRDLLDPNIGVHTRTKLIITVDQYECNATYEGDAVCGGIIRDFGADGIFKLAIGTEELEGTGRKWGWLELENQNEILESSSDPQQIVCDPNDIGLTAPKWAAVFKATDCGNNLEPCLYKLDEDPCEYENKADDTDYEDYLNVLMDELKEAYDTQAEPFWGRSSCSEAQPEDVIGYMEFIGYWTPFAPVLNSNDSSLTKENTPIYTDVCIESTSAPTTKTPTSAPITTSPTTDAPTTSEPTTSAPTTSHPTSAPTTKTPTSAPTTDAPTISEPTSAPTTKTPTSTPITGAPTTSEANTAVLIVDGVDRTWQEVREYCVETYNSDIASIILPAEETEITTLLQAEGIDTVWIGLLAEINGNPSAKTKPLSFEFVDGSDCPSSEEECLISDGWLDGEAIQVTSGTQCARLVKETGTGDLKVVNDEECDVPLSGILCNVVDDEETETYTTCGIQCTCSAFGEDECFESIKCESGKSPQCECTNDDDSGLPKTKCKNVAALEVIGNKDVGDNGNYGISRYNVNVNYVMLYLGALTVVVVVVNTCICCCWWNYVKRKGYQKVEIVNPLEDHDP